MKVLRLFVLLATAAPVLAADPVDSERMAEKLVQSTVTLRIATPGGELAFGLDAQQPDSASNAPRVKTESIYLASGVSLGDGLIVTYCTAPLAARFRATLPDGQQAEAQLRVADDYSGLRLIEVPQRMLPALPIADQAPRPGAPVMSAAAMGLEDPLVSLGTVGGVDHALPGLELPVLVCDLRSVETSSGGPVVNRDGELVGVVAATSNTPQKAGWTYAVPARHVRRLVEAKADNQTVVLRRERPVAGFTLGPGVQDGLVQVERVETGGPADRAGIKAGDLLLEAEGRKIRSAYQAIDLILRKLPGEKVPLVVQRDGQPRSVSILLAGTPEASQAYKRPVDPAVQVGPQVNVVMTSPNAIEVRRGSALPVQDNSVVAAPEALPQERPGLAADDNDLVALKKQLAAFERMVARLQEELRRRDETQAQTNQLIQSMTEEIGLLRKRLEQQK